MGNVTLTGTVIDKPRLEFDTPGWEESAELQFTIVDECGNETGVAFRHNPLSEGTPTVLRGQTVTIPGFIQQPGGILEMEDGCWTGWTAG